MRTSGWHANHRLQRRGRFLPLLLLACFGGAAESADGPEPKTCKAGPVGYPGGPRAETAGPAGTSFANKYAFAVLQADGSIVVWGDSCCGGANGPTDKGYVAVYSNPSAFAALKADGSIFTWGRRDHGGGWSPADNGYVAVYSTNGAFAAVKADGSIFNWGPACYGGESSGQRTPVLRTTRGYVAVYSTAYAFAAVKGDGSIFTWGYSNYGGANGPADKGYVAVYSNYYAFAAIKADGSIFIWGESNQGEDFKDDGPADNGYVAVYSTADAFAAVKADGSVYTWGFSEHGGATGPTDNGYVSVYSTRYAFAAVKGDGSIFFWGGSGFGGVDGPADKGYVAVYSTQAAFAAVKADGSIFAWGCGTCGGSGGPTDKGYVAVYSTQAAFAAVKADGSVFAWGGGTCGGSGGPTDKGYVAVYATSAAFAAVKADGSIFTWGDTDGDNGPASVSTGATFAGPSFDGSQGARCAGGSASLVAVTSTTTVTLSSTTTSITTSTTTTTVTYTSTTLTSTTSTTTTSITATTTTDPTSLLCGQPGQPECTGAVVCAAAPAAEVPTTTTTTLTTTTTTTATRTTTTNTTVFCTSAQDALDNGEASGCAFPTTFTADLELEEWMIPALRWVEKIEGYLKIYDQHYLTSLSSILPNLGEVTGYLNIESCNGLVKDVAGFANLVKVGLVSDGSMDYDGVYVQNNKNLEVLDNRLFPNLAFTGGDVKVNTNVKLTNISNYLPSLEKSIGGIYIDGNTQLATMVNVCKSLVTSGSVEIDDADDLTALDSTTGFGNLATSTGTIKIVNNDELLSINGVFESLVTARNVQISGNPALTSLDSTIGFGNLATITHAIIVSVNNELLTINGVFPALTAVASYIRISNNDKLHTVGPARFGAPSSPVTIAVELAVYDNKVLADVTGLQGLVCTATDKCAMVWFSNNELDKNDVCGVWGSMTGTGPKRHSSTKCDGGSRDLPCYGSAGGYGTAANCGTTAAVDPTTTTTTTPAASNTIAVGCGGQMAGSFVLPDAQTCQTAAGLLNTLFEASDENPVECYNDLRKGGVDTIPGKDCNGQGCHLLGSYFFPRPIPYVESEWGKAREQCVRVAERLNSLLFSDSHVLMKCGHDSVFFKSVNTGTLFFVYATPLSAANGDSDGGAESCASAVLLLNAKLAARQATTSTATTTTATTITTTTTTTSLICACADGHVATADRLGCTSNSTTSTTSETATSTTSTIPSTTLPQPLLCNGTPDSSDCITKVAISDCGTILFSSINASSLCPAMCNACTVTTTAVPAKAVGDKPLSQDGKTNVGNGNNDTEGTNNQTDTGEEEADAPTTAKSNAGMIVGIVLPLLIFIGIGVAVFALRKKEQGRQRAFTHTRGPPARHNPTFDFEEAAAAAANTAGMSDYEEIDENDDMYEQPANAYEQPVAQQQQQQQQAMQDMVPQVDDGMYEMPDPRTNQYADMGLGLNGDGPAPNRSAVANATYGSNAAEVAINNEASNSADAGQGVLYDAASASGQATYSLGQNDAGQQQQQQQSPALYDEASADAGQGVFYDAASASGQATYSLAQNGAGQQQQQQQSQALYDEASADAGRQASYSMASATVQGAVYDQAAMSTQATYNLAGAEDDNEGIEL